MILKVILSIFIALLAFTEVSFAKVKKIIPARITSDIIDIKRNSQTIDFIGNVFIKKGSETMLAEKMTVYYFQESDIRPIDKNGQKASIKKIEAKEKVKISNADFVATGDYGYYDPALNLFTLQDNVAVDNGSSIAHGSKFIYDLNSKKGNLIGGEKQLLKSDQNRQDKRVVVIINEDTKKQKKNK